VKTGSVDGEALLDTQSRAFVEGGPGGKLRDRQD